MQAVSRRRFLLSTAILGGAGLALLATRRALAFSLEEGNAETQALYFDHFNNVNRYHAQLVAEITARLKGHPQSEIDAAVAAARCPICGLPIA